jgi:NAD(P)-dependent dehydrogenase (short-subunit alcohol dehydrogenase family)
METVLITGCSSGIGRATARAFLDHGWQVYATARDPDDVADLADAGCETPALDVTDDNAVERVVARAVDEGGGLDCLVNNAGYGQFGAVEDLSTERLHAQFDVNVYGPHRLCRAALPHMREAGDGTIVNVSSVLGRVTVPGGGAYCASKWALEALSEALRVEVAPHGVSVTLVEPGPVNTSFGDRAASEHDAVQRTAAYERLYAMLDDGMLAGSAVGEVEPERIARAIRRAATRADPPARLPVGWLARLTVMGRHLPDRVREAGFRLAARLAS